jgi:vacuolar-type H+-ATPase subunit I/STV1
VRIIKAIYNFIVGDMVILIGIVLTVTVLALINNVSALAPLKDFSGPFLVLGVLSSLVATLSREAFSFHP